MCIIIYNMGGESQKKWLGVGKLQKFKCNSQVQKNLLGLFLPFSQFLYRYYKNVFPRSLFSQIGHRKIPAEHKKGEGGAVKIITGYFDLLLREKEAVTR